MNLIDRGKEEYSFRVKTKRGRINFLEARAWIGKWNNKDCIYNVFRNVTKEKENLNLFSTMFKSSPLPMSITDKETKRMVKINPEFLSKTGYSREEIICENFENLGAFKNPEDIEDILTKLKTGKDIKSKDIEVKCKDGSILHGIFSVERIIHKGRESFLTVMIDITKKVELQTNLEDKLQKLKNIIEGAKLGTWEWNMETNEFNLNDQAANNLGYELGEFGIMNTDKWENLIHPEDLKKSKGVLERHMNGELEYYDRECRMKSRDGDWKWFENRGKIINRGKEGNPIKMFGTSLDITTKKEQALELERFFSVNLDLLCIVDKRGNFIKTNKAWEEVLGYSSEELKGANVRKFLHDKDVEKTEHALSKLQKNNEVKEFVNRHKNTKSEYRYI